MATKHLNLVHVPDNSDSAPETLQLSRLTGMQRLALSHHRIPPGAASIIQPNGDEGFIYILSGQGALGADGVSEEIGAGDVVGFPTAPFTHHISNPFTEDLVYLMGTGIHKSLYDPE